MKWLSIFLALNLLVATNGIALYDHFCSAEQTTETKSCCDESEKQDCTTNEDDEDCCFVNYTDFLKQDIEAYHSSNLELEQLFSFITFNVLYPSTSIFILAEEGIVQSTIDPPPLLLCKTANDRSLLQIFRC